MQDIETFINVHFPLFFMPNILNGFARRYENKFS